VVEGDYWICWEVNLPQAKSTRKALANVLASPDPARSVTLAATLQTLIDDLDQEIEVATADYKNDMDRELLRSAKELDSKAAKAAQAFLRSVMEGGETASASQVEAATGILTAYLARP